MMIWYDVIICLCACRAVWTRRAWNLALYLFFSPFSPYAFSPLSYMILLSPPGFSVNFSTIYLQYSSFSPSSITSIMNLGLWSVWGPKLLLTVASPTGCSHGAPNASLEYWINPTTTSVLPNQHRHYFLTITLHGGLGLWRMDGLWICCVVSEGRDNRYRQVEHLRLFYAIPFWLQSLPSQL